MTCAWVDRLTTTKLSIASQPCQVQTSTGRLKLIPDIWDAHTCTHTHTHTHNCSVNGVGWFCLLYTSDAADE